MQQMTEGFPQNERKSEYMPYVIYLRKSREDLQAERSGLGDTLARHRRTLLELAERQHLAIGGIYEEIVSGDSIAARPQMQRLLQEISESRWEGALVMEIERLARGDTMDQGLVANAFKYSGAKIVTPNKVYDPESEIDEEYFEFSLFMSRREYKTINRRLKAGTQASLQEGKFTSSVAPYGYDRLKLRGEKGWTLTPNKDADTVRSIFSMYLSGMTMTAIVIRLNAQGVKPARGKEWTEAGVSSLLRNAHYAGFIVIGSRPAKKSVVNGEVRVSRPRNKDRRLVPGRHERLVSPEDFELAQQRLSQNRRPPVRRDLGTQNPLLGLVCCDQCGKHMHRRVLPNTAPTLMCQTRGCPTIMHDLQDIERQVIENLRRWLDDLQAESVCDDIAPNLESLRTSLARLDTELRKLSEREARTYTLLEDGIYSAEEFKSRRAAIAAERTAFLSSRAAAQEELDQTEQALRSRRDLVPAVANVLDVYWNTDSMEERNKLLRTIVRRIDYHKTIRITRANNPTDLALTIHPTFTPVK